MKSYTTVDTASGDDKVQFPEHAATERKPEHDVPIVKSYENIHTDQETKKTDVAAISDEMNKASKNTNRLILMIVAGAVVFIILASLPSLVEKYSGKEPTAYFTEIDNSMDYMLGPDSTISLPCMEENKDSGLIIKFTLFDETADAYCYDKPMQPGEVSEWKPGDYIADRDITHDITIIQTAYKKSDDLLSQPLKENKTTIKVTIAENPDKLTIKEQVGPDDGNIQQDANQDAEQTGAGQETEQPVLAE